MSHRALIPTLIKAQDNKNASPPPKKANVPITSEKNTWTSACTKKK